MLTRVEEIENRQKEPSCPAQLPYMTGRVAAVMCKIHVIFCDRRMMSYFNVVAKSAVDDKNRLPFSPCLV